MEQTKPQATGAGTRVKNRVPGYGGWGKTMARRIAASAGLMPGAGIHAGAARLLARP